MERFVKYSNGPGFRRYWHIAAAKHLFDSNGNIIEQYNSETDTLSVVRYEYDNHPYPMRGLNTYGLPDPFTCPNNVVHSLDSHGQIQWDREFTYNDTGLLLTCIETDGIEYHYQNK